MLALLAQTPYPLSIEFQTGLIGFGILVLVSLKIWDLAKRKPALEETFATKNELEADKKNRQTEFNAAERDREKIRLELKALDDRTEKKIEALDRRREAGEKENREAIHREVTGMKEFISDKIAENRENNTGRFAELASKLDTFQVSIQGLSNDVMHQIGRLEGQMDLVKKKAA